MQQKFKHLATSITWRILVLNFIKKLIRIWMNTLFRRYTLIGLQYFPWKENLKKKKLRTRHANKSTDTSQTENVANCAQWLLFPQQSLSNLQILGHDLWPSECVSAVNTSLLDTREMQLFFNSISSTIHRLRFLDGVGLRSIGAPAASFQK